METEAADRAQSNSPAAIPIGAFVYTPLPDASDYIRLLRPLGPFPEVGAAAFELTTHLMGDLPKYHAISYTWGSNDVQYDIVVNQRLMKVNASARYALWQACAQNFYDDNGNFAYLWMDAICINQSDLEEKGSQVQMMADVYRLAEQVFACIGSHGADSELLSEFFQTDAILEAQNYKHVMRKPAEYCSGIYSNEQATHIAAEWLLSQDQEYLEDVCGAMAEIAHRPYWGRMWIVQELCMGMNCIVLCGHDFFYVSDLLFLAKVIEDMLDMELTVEDRWSIEAAWAYMSEGFMRRALQPEPDSRERLGHRLRELKDFKCRDPRDRLYALNAMVYWGEERPRLMPDYTIGAFEVLVQAIEHVKPSMELATPFTESPSELVTYSVLEALQIDASHDQMHHGVNRRQSSNISTDSSTPNSSIRHEYTYAFGQLSASEKHQGELAVPFRQVDDDKSEESTGLLRLLEEVELRGSTSSFSAKFEGRIPRRLFAGEPVAGLVCSGAKVGDYLLSFTASQSVAESVAQVYIVLRSHLSGTCEIIGQAIIFAPYEPDILFPIWEEYENEEMSAMPLGPIYELTVTAEDLVILAGQDFLLPDESHSKRVPRIDSHRVIRKFNMQARLLRLVTAVTISRNCGARVLEKISDAQAYRALITACSFGHMTRNAGRLEQKRAFSQKQTHTGFVFMQESVPVRHFAGPVYHTPGDPCPVHGQNEHDATDPTLSLFRRLNFSVMEPQLPWKVRAVDCTCHKSERTHFSIENTDENGLQ